MRSHLPALCLAALCQAQPAFAADAYQPGTDGALIEEQFKSLAATCFLNTAGYSDQFLPGELKVGEYRTKLDRPRDATRVIDGVRFEYLARSVFDRRGSLRPQLARVDSNPALLDLTFPEALPFSDANSLVYGLTCGSQMKLALDQGYSFGFMGAGYGAAVKQALTVHSDVDAKNSFVLMYGTFFSPLHQVLASPRAELAVRGYAALWELYARRSQNGADLENRGYLRAIKGWLITRGSTREMASLVQATVGGNASFFGLKAEVSSSAKLNYDSKFSATYFKILLEDPLTQAELEPLPDLARINKAVEAATTFYPAERTLFERGRPIAVSARIRGIPSWLCNDQWVASSEHPGVRFDGVTSDAATIEGVCELKTSFVLDGAVSEAEIPVALKNTSRTVTVGGTTRSLTLPRTIRVRAQQDPEPVLMGAALATRDRSSSAHTFNVTAPFGLFPVMDPREVFMPGTPELKCGTTIPKATIYTAYAPVAVGPGQYRLNVTVRFDEGEAIPQGPCSLHAELTFVRREGGPMTKPLRNVQVSFGER